MADYSLFDHGATPALTSGDASDSPLTLGVLWQSSTPGTVKSIWMYIGNTNLNGAAGTALLYTGGGWADAPGSLMAQKAFTFQGTIGWQEVVLDSPISVNANTLYIAAVHINSSGHYSYIDHLYDTEQVSGVLTALHGAPSPGYDRGNGRYMSGASPAYPQNKSLSRASYLIDFTFSSSSGGGGGGSSVTVQTSASSTALLKNTATTLTATPSNGTNYTYQWSVLFGNGTFGTPTAGSTTFTPSTATKTIIKCTVTATEGTAAGYVTLDVADPVTTTTGHFTASATDTLSASSSGTATKQIQRGGSPSRQERSLYGHRLSFGDAITNPAPAVEAIYDLAGTFSLRTYIKRNCTLTKVRVLKAPLATGNHTVVIWQLGNTTPLATKVLPFVADDGGWVEFELDEPLALTASNTVPYLIGYHTSSGHYMRAQWVYGSQITHEYPFEIGVNGGGIGLVEGTGYTSGASPSYPTSWLGHGYFIDPVVEWESDSTVYTGGYEYYHRFSAWSDLNHFPIGVWSSLPESVAGFKALGINLMVAPYGEFQVKRDAIVAANIDTILTVEPGDLATAAKVAADSTYNALVRGFLMADEPDMIPPWRSPDDLKAWYAQLRSRDSSKLLVFNLGKWPVVNKGYAYLPSTATIPQVNQYWREYAHLTDILSCDFYMEDPQNTDGGNLGLWCNPRMIQRLQDLSDKSRPVWHYIATTAPPGTEPTPQLVYNSVWSALIGGARGIVYFDTQFTSGNVYISDFAMNSYPAMAAKVTALNAQIQSLAAPLMSEDAKLPVQVASSNTSAPVNGGTFGVPIHYIIRQAAGSTYLFTQSIRPGTTTGTFTVPAAANKTITVIDEGRTLSANGSGVFSDSFTADYQVHLYRWS
jgi:hypothetical protein